MSYLVATNVHKTYRLKRKPVPVLKGVSLSIARGEFVAIIGATGSGKSTLLHLLGGLDTPDRTKGEESSIVFDGRPLQSIWLDRFRAGSVGFVFQFYHLLPELTVLENVCLAAMAKGGYNAAASEARAQELLAGFGMGHRLQHRPAELSGGERQRVAIARALINDPPLLLADEPTGNLDAATGGAILDQLLAHRAATGGTMVVVTHSAELARRADRVVKLVSGHVEAA